MKHSIRRRERGSALVALFVSLTVCGAVSAGVLITSGSRNKEAQTHLASERSLQLAEAAADWGISQIRIRNGVIPTTGSTTTVPGVGTFTCSYLAGRPGNAADADYSQVIATGKSGNMKRTLRVILKKAIIVPTFDAAVQLNVNVPILDLSGNSFTIQGADHLINGSVDSSKPAKYGIASPAAAADLTAQIDSKNIDQVTGLGWTSTTASVGQVPMIDLNTLFASATSSASIIATAASYQHPAWGSPVTGGTVIVYRNGDLKLTGNGSGAGILAVDGDLEMAGGFQWTGIILVRGRVTLTGGGNTKKVIGALAVGQDITATTSTTTIDAGGTVDLLFSSAAVTLAADSFSVMTIASWGEVANP